MLYQVQPSTAGHLLWLESARQLIVSGRRRGAALADAHIFTCYALRAFQVEPAAVIQLDQCEHYHRDCAVATESTISSSSWPIAAERAVGQVGFQMALHPGTVEDGFEAARAALGRAEGREIDPRRKDFAMRDGVEPVWPIQVASAPRRASAKTSYGAC